MSSNLENPPNPTQLHDDFIKKVDAWEAKKAWLEVHRTVDISFIKKLKDLSKAVDTLGKKLKKNVSNHAILYPDIDLMRKKVWPGMARIKKAIEICSPFEITSSIESGMDIEETVEDNKNKNNSTKNYDVATIDNAVEKNFEIEQDVDSLEEIYKIETTENPTETTTDEDSEEKVEDKIENKRTETNSTDSNFEIEHAVESLEENGDAAAALEKGTDDPVKEETKENYEIEQAVDPSLNATSDDEQTDVIEYLDFVENKLIEEKKEPVAKPDDVARVGSVILRKAAENVKLKDEEHEAEVEKISVATLKNVPFPFDPRIEIDATEDTHNLEVQAEEKETEDDSESQDVSEESLDFQPDAPSVVVCCYCRNTSPSIVLYFNTRRAKTADLNESDLSAPSDLNTSIITEEVEAIDDTEEAEDIVDAREVHEDILEAMNEGTKGEENDDRY